MGDISWSVWTNIPWFQDEFTIFHNSLIDFRNDVLYWLDNEHVPAIKNLDKYPAAISFCKLLFFKKTYHHFAHNFCCWFNPKVFTTRLQSRWNRWSYWNWYYYDIRLFHNCYNCLRNRCNILLWFHASSRFNARFQKKEKKIA